MDLFEQVCQVCEYDIPIDDDKHDMEVFEQVRGDIHLPPVRADTSRMCELLSNLRTS